MAPAGSGDWFTLNAPTSTTQPAPSGTTTTQPSGDPRAAIWPILQRYPATPEGLKQAWPEIQRLYPGAVLEDSDEFVIPGYGRVDVGKAFEGGDTSNMAWVWQHGTGGSSGGTSVTGLPPGYSTGTYTGGGKYPLASVMGPGLMQPWTTAFQSPGDFKAPTMAQAEASPGFQFRLKEGEQAIQRAAASKGTLLTGGTLKDLTKWGQELASQEYDKVYGRSLGENNLAYNRALGEYQQAYGIYGNNQANQYNRLSGMAATGLSAAGGAANASGQYAGQAGGLMTDIGNARAGAQAASGAAWGNAVGNTSNAISQAILLGSILNQQPGPQQVPYYRQDVANVENSIYG
jgi:hypothetical protein